MSIHGVNARQLQIISILKEAKCTNTAELQEELGVSRRTLRTDIAYLNLNAQNSPQEALNAQGATIPQPEQ